LLPDLFHLRLMQLHIWISSYTEEIVFFSFLKSCFPDALIPGTFICLPARDGVSVAWHFAVASFTRKFQSSLKPIEVLCQIPQTSRKGSPGVLPLVHRKQLIRFPQNSILGWCFWDKNGGNGNILLFIYPLGIRYSNLILTSVLLFRLGTLAKIGLTKKEN